MVLLQGIMNTSSGALHRGPDGPRIFENTTRVWPAAGLHQEPQLQAASVLEVGAFAAAAGLQQRREARQYKARNTHYFQEGSAMYGTLYVYKLLFWLPEA
jgi:hypothetical protein